MFDVKHSGELEPLDEIIGQERAVEAVRFGIDMRRRGFNVFVFGRSGSGKLTTIQRFLADEAKAQPAPDGWCYVYNFGRETYDASQPKALRVPPGCAATLRSGMDQAIEELLVDLPALFESDAFAARRRQIVTAYEARTRALFDDVGRQSAERGVAVVRGEEGVGILPLDEKGEVMPPDAFRALPEAQQTARRERMQETEAALEAAVRAARQVQRERRQALQAVEREMAASVVAAALDPLRDKCKGASRLLEHLDAVAADLLDHLDLFQPASDGSEGQGDAGEAGGGPGETSAATGTPRSRRLADRRLRRYAVNVIVEHDPGGGAPVVVESHPTLSNLVGRLEYESQFGALVTDFTMIRPGALHRANGGYLVIEVEELLKQAGAWDGIKRALRNEVIRLEAQGEDGGPAATVTLAPEPVPLDCKVVLVGESHVYYLLHAIDNEFPELFKVGAEFGEVMPRTPETVRRYARFIAGVAKRERLQVLDRDALAAVVDHGARLAEDAERLSTRFLDITDLLREADYWSRRRGGRRISGRDVDQALEARIRRIDLARELVHEAYERDIILLDTSGHVVGQVNGLTIVSRGQFEFGMPVRITARVRMGSGEVVNIEREVELSGPLHSKGVLTLSGFIAGRYLPNDPLSMMASLTFEQSYAEVDGDSASSAELYALLSALADVPVDQALAVTGSVNQAGEVQAIGGVNEKIEGYFDICRQRGLTGEQGVLIPAANVQHLMLRRDVVEAVRSRSFHVYPVGHVDEGVELLLGVAAGERGEDGEYPPCTVNRLVEERLRLLAEKRREMTHGGEEDDPESR